MPTTPTTKDAKQALYAVAGAADLAVSTIQHLPEEAAKLRARLPEEAVKTYGQLVNRGETWSPGSAARARPARPPRRAKVAVSRTRRPNTGAPGARHHPVVGEVSQHHRASGRRRRHKAAKAAASKVGEK